MINHRLYLPLFAFTLLFTSCKEERPTNAVATTFAQPYGGEAQNDQDTRHERKTDTQKNLGDNRNQQTYNTQKQQSGNYQNQQSRYNQGQQSRYNQGLQSRYNQGQQSGNASNGSQLVELPAKKKGEKLIRHKAYTLSFNEETNTPNWVAWELTRYEAKGHGQRANEFLPDPNIKKEHQVEDFDYVGSGYDRGHMCPAGDNKWDGKAMTECFYLSNMCPQLHAFNSESWEALESACRRWAKKEGSVYIICGPIYDKNRKAKTIGRQHKISVPNAFFKCIVSLKKGHEKAIAFYYQHNKRYQTMEEAARTVDELEALTGYDFFSIIDDQIENKIEATYNLTEWD